MGVPHVSGAFKVCGACRRAWATWHDFVTDPAVRLLGLQSVASGPSHNLLVFEHGCGSSISLLTRRLRHLLPEPESDAPLPVLFGTRECRGHCLHLEDLEACVAPCANVHDRALILIVQSLKKAARNSAKA